MIKMKEKGKTGFCAYKLQQETRARLDKLQLFPNNPHYFHFDIPNYLFIISK